MDRDWALFEDWCLASGVEPLRSGRQELARFREALSDSPATAERRARHISSRLGLSSDPEPWEPSADLLTAVGDVLAASTVTGWPDGVRGRRDAAVVVLRNRLGLTRHRIRSLRPTDFTPGLGSLAVCGRRVPDDPEPRRCPACALSRWLRIAAPVTDATGWRRVRDRLAAQWPVAAGTERDHDCARPLPAGWRGFRVLVPAIDRHGWVVDSGSLSARSISAVTNRRPDRAELATADILGPPSPRPRTVWDRASQVRDLEYLGPLFDRLEHEIDAALDRTRELLRGD